MYPFCYSQVVQQDVAQSNRQEQQVDLFEFVFITLLTLTLPSGDNILAIVIVWRIRGKIIRTVLCCVVYPMIHIHIHRRHLYSAPIGRVEEMVFAARRSYANAVLGVVILSVCPSVHLSVCHTRAL